MTVMCFPAAILLSVLAGLLGATGNAVLGFFAVISIFVAVIACIVGSIFGLFLASTGEGTPGFFLSIAALLDIVSLIFLFFFFNSVKNGAITLLEQGEHNSNSKP